MGHELEGEGVVEFRATIYSFRWFGGIRDNCRAEMLVLWGALQVVMMRNIDTISVIGDSRHD